jgi:hypothetical protein
MCERIAQTPKKCYVIESNRDLDYPREAMDRDEILHIREKTTPKASFSKPRLFKVLRRAEL